MILTPGFGDIHSYGLVIVYNWFVDGFTDAETEAEGLEDAEGVVEGFAESVTVKDGFTAVFSAVLVSLDLADCVADWVTS